MKRDYAKIEEEAKNVVSQRFPDLARFSGKNPPVGEALVAMVGAVLIIMLFALFADVSFEANEFAATIAALVVAGVRYVYVDRMQKKYFSELNREIEKLEGSNP